MSIIERVAELLGPLEQGSNSIDIESRERDTIVRTISENAERSVLPGFREPTLRPEQDVHGKVDRGGSPSLHISEVPATLRTRKAQATAESDRVLATFKVDRDHLRQQGLIQPDSARTPVAECFRLIKSQLLTTPVSSIDQTLDNLVMVTSALPGEGKSFCAVNLAISIALERDRSVLLVDGDVVNPSVPRMLGLSPERGLLDLLDDPRIEVEDLLCKVDIGKLTILSAGMAHQQSTELLASDAMRALVKELAERYHDRVIIFDSPPLLAASEASALSSHMGRIVVVVEAGRTPERALEDALGRIDSSKVAGLLLNKGQGPRQGYGYGGYA